MDQIIKYYEGFNVKQIENIAVLTLDKPESANTFGASFPTEFYRGLNDISENGSIKVVVMKAEGRIFSAGGSMEIITTFETPYQWKMYINKLNKAVKTMYEMPQPIICAIDGPSAGGGSNLALSCDFVIASERAKFSDVFVNLGIVGDTGGLWNLCKLVGPMRAKEIAMRGLTINAEEALQLGLVLKIVPSERIDEEVMNLAREIAAKPMFALRSIKSLVNKMPHMTHDTYCEIEEDLISVMLFTKDHKEGVRAFLEKRAPNFVGEDSQV